MIYKNIINIAREGAYTRVKGFRIKFVRIYIWSADSQRFYHLQPFLTTNNYVEIRNFLVRLSKMDNRGSEIYVIGLDIRNSDDKGICGGGVSTENIFNTDWGKITDIKELVNKLDIVFY